MVRRRKEKSGYFGCTSCSPPGVPGGRMTGIFPWAGGSCVIAGSMPPGGRITPPCRCSLSLSGSPEPPDPGEDPSWLAPPSRFKRVLRVLLVLMLLAMGLWLALETLRFIDRRIPRDR